MENTRLKCPLCCDRQFDSKLQLVEHLSTTLENITCSICNSKWTSISHLIEHLTLDNCQADHTSQTICFDITSEPENNENEIENSEQTPEHIQIEPHKDLSDQHISTINDSIDGGPDMGRMYVEFISKQLTKPCLQTQELKLVKEAGGISRYVFVMNDDDDKDETNADGDVEMDSKIRVVTKQNSDGTVSLTTVRDLKMETDTDPLMNPPVDDSQEIYSCNTCGVSFTSVLDHIQNYHNDQDVVVEEPVEDMDGSPNESIELQNEINNTERTEEASADKQLSRRMITETGDIIEAPLVMRTTSILPDENHSKKLSPVKVSTKKLPTPHRRHVVVDSVIKEINQPDDKPGPYHKVVVRMMERTNGETVKIFHCMICQIYVASLDDFKFHPCKRSKYSCMQCPVTYDNAKSLCAHMKVHKAKPAISGKTAQRSEFECEICNTLFTTTKSLKLHKRMHDPIKARPIEPPVETADGLEVSNDKFLCSVCHKLIPIDYRAVHQRSHKGKSGLTCEVCNKEFQSEEYLEMHMNVHLGDKIPTNKQDNRSLPYMCLYCDRRFSRPHEKVKHERIHTGEKPHSCEICGKSFRVSYCLTLHLRTHTGARPYSCPHCGKRFKAHSVYNHHLQTHSEVRAYKCPYCPKAFKTSVQLAGHKNSHTKPFSCQQCNRPFASLYAVRVHQETHARQNSLKFSCALCGASYARAFALKDHIKAVHSEETDKVDIDKTIDSILDKKENDVLSTVVEKTEDWSMENVEENATEEITDTKNLTHEVDVSEVFSNGNFPE